MCLPAGRQGSTTILMIKYLQLPFQFDVAAMQAEVKALTQAEWPLHYQTKHYDGEWSALALRSIDGSVENILISPLDNAPYKDTELLQRSPYLQTVLQTIQCPLLAVRLQKLGAGAIIKEHTDGGLCVEEGLLRLHIPVVTNDEVELLLEGEQMKIKEGECWYMNFNLPHSLNNRSAVDRIHLVIDAVVNEWVTELFNSASVTNKKEIAGPEMDKASKKEMIFHLRQMNTPVSLKMADELEKEI
jgi:hypothetical protein